MVCAMCTEAEKPPDAKPPPQAPALLFKDIWREEGTAEGHYIPGVGELLNITATTNSTTTVLQNRKQAFSLCLEIPRQGNKSTENPSPVITGGQCCSSQLIQKLETCWVTTFSSLLYPYILSEQVAGSRGHPCFSKRSFTPLFFNPFRNQNGLIHTLTFNHEHIQVRKNKCFSFVIPYKYTGEYLEKSASV